MFLLSTFLLIIPHVQPYSDFATFPPDPPPDPFPPETIAQTPCEIQMILATTYWSSIATDHYKIAANYDRPLEVRAFVVCRGQIEVLDPECRLVTKYVQEALDDIGNSISDISPLVFNVTKTHSLRPDSDWRSIEVRFIDNEEEHKKIHRCTFGDSVIAHAAGTYVHLNMEDYEFDFSPVIARTGTLLMANILLHELGHAMGLPHAEGEVNSIMFPEAIFPSRIFLDTFDKLRLRTIYEPARRARSTNRPSGRVDSQPKPSNRSTRINPIQPHISVEIFPPPPEPPVPERPRDPSPRSESPRRPPEPPRDPSPRSESPRRPPEPPRDSSPRSESPHEPRARVPEPPIEPPSDRRSPQPPSEPRHDRRFPEPELPSDRRSPQPPSEPRHDHRFPEPELPSDRRSPQPPSEPRHDHRFPERAPEPPKPAPDSSSDDPDEAIAAEARRATADYLLQLMQFFTRKIQHDREVNARGAAVLKHLM